MRWGVVLPLLAGLGTSSPDCRCIPSEPCWPSQADFQALNDTISGQLLLNEPVAIACYPGPKANPAECASVDANWANNTFQQQFPLGYSYPFAEPCPPINASAGEVPSESSCTLGDAPVYTVNATETAHVAAGIAFAREQNLRLAVRNTGHDLLDRSTGFGSLQVWIRYLRKGITYHESFKQEGSGWEGKAFTVGGGYVWSEVYAEAGKRNVIVVGGGTPSVGVLGGWMQGGGHSPASHDYGLGADNVLQAKVILADGSLVTASPSENEDLFFAIRGGGPGTYGVVVETTIKAYPTTNVVAQSLAFAPLTANATATFTEVLTDLYQSFPSLATAGWSGYGTWSIEGPAPIFAAFTTGYAHTIANFNKSIDAAAASFAPTLARLQALNGTELIAFVQYTAVPTYAEYYAHFSGVEPPAGTLGATGARFLDTQALTGNRSALKAALEVVAGTSQQKTTNVVEFFGAAQGQIALDGWRVKPVSGVNPAWRDMVVHHILSRGWTQDTPADEIEAIERDVLFVKQAALKTLAPDTGAYMNEANALDPDYKRTFYGSLYRRLDDIKRKRDPEDIFYCPTCVGSERWQVRDNGQLCKTELKFVGIS